MPENIAFDLDATDGSRIMTVSQNKELAALGQDVLALVSPSCPRRSRRRQCGDLRGETRHRGGCHLTLHMVIETIEEQTGVVVDWHGRRAA